MSDSQTAWDGVDRRSTTTPITPQGAEGDLWRYLVAQLESTNAKLGAIHIDMIGQKADIQHLHNDVELIKRAFPKNDEGNRDYHGHHDHHDELIKTSKRWAEIGTDVAKKVFGGMAWLAVVFVAMAMWEKFKASLGLPPVQKP